MFSYSSLSIYLSFSKTLSYIFDSVSTISRDRHCLSIVRLTNVSSLHVASYIIYWIEVPNQLLAVNSPYKLYVNYCLALLFVDANWLHMVYYSLLNYGRMSRKPICNSHLKICMSICLLMDDSSSSLNGMLSEGNSRDSNLRYSYTASVSILLLYLEDTLSLIWLISKPSRF